ncbi:MAG: divergent polysaccharide deacetylase family protein [Treponema sp.]|jgi:polysaccharide deacetylase 2 family uncharacterized protein YibQ|nr:divergent polysaccharide deacetylase family protein [Treponema sp.]
MKKGSGKLKSRKKSAVKRGAKPKVMAKKRFKAGKNDLLQAFLLVFVLVVCSACISMAVIKVHSTIKEGSHDEASNNEKISLSAGEDASNNVQPVEPLTENPQVKPSVSVSVQQPEPERSAPVTAPPVENIAAGSSVPPNRRAASSVPTASSAASTTNTAAVVSSRRTAVRPIEEKGALVFVIDDAGNNLKDLEAFLNIPYPLTIAVLPGLPNSAESARRIRAAGKEVILHQPMEAIGAQEPGPGAIYSWMDEEVIKEILLKNIKDIGPVAGINNHQGSKVTMNREAMEAIISFCVEQEIYFLDSRTTSETAAAIAAQALGVNIAQRDVFLDNEQNRDVMQRYLNTGLSRAQRVGQAVMIGHTWSPELAPLLAEQFPTLIEEGYTIKTVSDILKY